MKKLVNGTSFSNIITIGNKKIINVSRNGYPFGCMWTWKNTKTEQHPWHVKTLDRKHACFWPNEGYKSAAMDWIEYQ